MAESSDQISVVMQFVTAFVERVVKKIVLDIVANLVRAPTEGGTPVDTGWARANWIPHIGSPAPGTAGTRAEAEQGAVSAQEREAGLAEVATGYKLELGSVYITNNVPYIVRLNEGSSRQAPAGFVQACIVKAITEDIRSI